MIRPARTTRTVLITGGAGFIGSHLADQLIAHGHHVRVLDNLDEQVHGPARQRPTYLNEQVQLIEADVRDRTALNEALKGCDAVYHFAARVGVGQSMYRIVDYTQVNNEGTASLLEALIDRPVRQLIVASSMSLYGEGLYTTRRNATVASNGRFHTHGNGRSNGQSNGQSHGHSNGSARPVFTHISRTTDQMKAHRWEPLGPAGESLIPLPTPETKSPNLASVYALSKYDQEQMCLIVGRAYNIQTTALRFFNVFGPRQALSNPYTGVLAIFASRLLNEHPPLIFEDGQQQRDFVSVHDVAAACRLALTASDAADQVFNVGSGQRYTICEIAGKLAAVLGKSHIQPTITGDYRAGDIRHCFADIDRARSVLGYEPRVSLEAGMTELAHWLEGQTPSDHVEQARRELTTRGLTV